MNVTQPEQPKVARRFLRATSAMMDALDVAEGMSSHELICFQHNTAEFLSQMITDAIARETCDKFRMERHDWGKDERKPL